MTLDDVKRLIALEGPALHACGVMALYVFGSVANGNAGPTSDVDLMIDYDPTSGFDLIDLSGVHLRLSERLGVNVDVVIRDNIHRRIREQVFKEAVRVF